MVRKGFSKSLSTAIVAALAVMALHPFQAAAQSQPGRIVVDDTGPSILEFDTDGSNGFSIAGNTDNNSVFSPSLAGDGTIAFTANTDVDSTYLGYPHIFLMNADGTNVRNVSSGLPGPGSNCCYNLSPAISPDGTTVAFLASLNAAPDSSVPQEIYLMNADGSNLRQLTPFMANPSDYSQSYLDGFAWSPDNSTLAFRGVVVTSVCGTYGGNPIYVNVIGTIKADGTGMQILACDNNDGYVTAIDWSPDGTLLAWGRNVSHGAQGCSGCVGEPALAFYDFSGQNRYSAGITSTQLTTDSCQGGTHCIHFSPDSTKLAYVDAYPNNGNPCQSSCNVSFVNLDGSGQTNSAIPSGGHTIWWAPGATIPAAAQITVEGPNGPTATVEVWPGFSQQVTPTLSDSGGALILNTAQDFVTTHYFYASDCLTIGPYGLAVYNSGAGGSGYGTISATNAGLTSATINFNCWPSSPCTYSLGSSGTNIPSGGGSGGVTVTADPGNSGSTCPWNATTSASWITITSGSNGAGNGSVSFSVAANTGPARQSTITIAGQTYTVSQDASGTATLQSITVTPNPASVTAGQTLQFTATGNYSDNSTKNLTASVTWSSSNAGIATISNAAGSQGLANGVSAGGPVTITATLNGVSGMAPLTVTTPAAAGLSAMSLSFGSQPVGMSSASQMVTLTNTGGSNLNISGISTTGANAGDFSRTTTCSNTLAPNANCTISVTFTPTATGARSAAVSIADNAAGSPQQVSLSGTGVAPAVTLSSASLTFGAQPLTTTSAAQTVTLTNSGTYGLGISGIAASAGFGQSNNCPTSTTLAPNASCTIRVTFSPTVSGTNNGTITISDTAANSPQQIALSGVGTDFSISASPSSVTIKPGGTATYTLALTSIHGFTGVVALACSDTLAAAAAPVKSSGACTITPTSLSLNGTGTATVKVKPGKTTATGTYTITFSGTSYTTLQHRTSVSLVLR